MAAGLGANGRVALYGLWFDTARGDLKRESDAMLVEMVEMLEESPTLNVYIVGHPCAPVASDKTEEGLTPSRDRCMAEPG